MWKRGFPSPLRHASRQHVPLKLDMELQDLMFARLALGLPAPHDVTIPPFQSGGADYVTVYWKCTVSVFSRSS